MRKILYSLSGQVWLRCTFPCAICLHTIILSLPLSLSLTHPHNKIYTHKQSHKTRKGQVLSHGQRAVTSNHFVDRPTRLQWLGVASPDGVVCRCKGVSHGGKTVRLKCQLVSETKHLRYKRLRYPRGLPHFPRQQEGRKFNEITSRRDRHFGTIFSKRRCNISLCVLRIVTESESVRMCN